MSGQIVCHILSRDKVSDLSIRVTSDVLQGCRTVGTFVQTLNGHNREYLVDGPGIRQGLEQREVTEIFIRQQFRQSAKFIGSMLQAACNLVHLTHNRPVKTLNLRTCFQIHNSMTEQVERFFTNLLCIVPGFQHLILIQCIPNAIKFLHQFMVFLSYFFIIVPFGQSGGFQHFKNKHGMMGSQCTSAFRNNIGMGNIIFITGIHQSGNRVIHIFLNGIIDAAFAAGRACSIVIYAQATTDINEFYFESHRVKLHIELRRFAQGCLNATDFCNLASDMEMYQFQTIFQSF